MFSLLYVGELKYNFSKYKLDWQLNFKIDVNMYMVGTLTGTLANHSQSGNIYKL